MNKILITGASGMVGKNLLPLLKKTRKLLNSIIKRVKLNEQNCG